MSQNQQSLEQRKPHYTDMLFRFCLPTPVPKAYPIPSLPATHPATGRAGWPRTGATPERIKQKPFETFIGSGKLEMTTRQP